MLQESLVPCGGVIKPSALKIRSTGVDEAGTHKARFATLKKAGYSSDFSFQKSKIFERNTVIVKTSSKYFLSCTLGVGFGLLVVFRLFIYFVKMFGTSGGQESPTVSAENELNHLLTMFTQKFYETIKGFQFHFAKRIVYGEENSNSLL